MKQDIFTKLPPEIIINILLKLPFRTITSCKCIVTPSLAVLEMKSLLNKIYEIKDVLNVQYHELDFHLLTKFKLVYHEGGFPLNFHGGVCGSADGLLLLVDFNESKVVYICNPITRDYLQPCYCQELAPRTCMVTYGFGASKMTGQYKVVRIIKRKQYDLQRNAQFECQVDTLGTGSWRRIDPGPTWGRIERRIFNRHDGGALLNGYLHWLLVDRDGAHVISCFNLETEHCSTLSLPILSTIPLPDLGQRRFRFGLSTLCECLCICDELHNDKIVIWLMKEYGVEKSWTKEYVIGPILLRGVRINGHSTSFHAFRPIKVLRDGDILMEATDYFLFIYSVKTKTVRRLDILGAVRPWSIDSILLMPRCISLESFAMEDVKSFDDPV